MLCPLGPNEQQRILAVFSLTKKKAMLTSFPLYKGFNKKQIQTAFRTPAPIWPSGLRMADVPRSTHALLVRGACKPSPLSKSHASTRTENGAASSAKCAGLQSPSTLGQYQRCRQTPLVRMHVCFVKKVIRFYTLKWAQFLCFTQFCR